ncbi:unnamed protein product [Linum tenue]|uniref:Uncharacterized protein n=1 Tax=Linum tenue TaxID=586396 RepID=A0AAV0RXH3_9ROSI|nr:unnamed protein product [Linum tenue]
MGSRLNLHPSSCLSSFLSIISTLLAGAGGSSRPPPKVPCYFIFGDSLFDGGNNNHLNTPMKVDHSPYGVDFPSGVATGRYSNGRNTADIVGELLGFKSFIPPFASTPNDSEILVGVNYASGTAGILVETGKYMGENIDMSQQVKNHEQTVSRIAQKLGSKKAADDHLGQCLYLSNMGNNDYIANYLVTQFSNFSKRYNPDQFAALLVEQYSHQLVRMHELGARKVGVAGVNRIGCTPGAITTYGTNGSLCVESMNKLVVPFNNRLESLIDNLNARFSDSDAKFIYLDSTLAGAIAGLAFPIKSSPCCKASPATGICIPNTDPCKLRRAHAYWDAFHPTEAASRLIALFYRWALGRIL